MALPSGFTQLEYIQSSGTQCIDTGFQHNQNTRVVMDVLPLAQTANAWLFEGRIANTSAAKGLFFFYSDTKKWSADYSTSSNRYGFSAGETDRLSIDYDKNTCTVNGVSTTWTSASFQSTVNLYLLACNTNGSIAGYANAKLYSCRIYDNGTLVRDFVPCTNSAGTAGLYDTVNGVFYQSAGSGAFTAGPVKKGTHKTMVDGTAYEIKGGKVMVDGTSYSIKKGKTLVDGTAYEIGFGCTVTISVKCDWSNKAYVVINGIKYDVSDSGGYTETISVQSGTTMECYVVSENGAPAAGQVLLNGTEVASHWYLTSPTLIYTYTISGNIKVTTSHSYYTSGSGIYGKIRIVEQ